MQVNYSLYTDIFQVVKDGAILRDLPEEGSMSLVPLKKGQRLRRLDMTYWNGAWMRFYADVPGGKKYEGYLYYADVEDIPDGEETPSELEPPDTAKKPVDPGKPAPKKGIEAISMDDYWMGRIEKYGAELDDQKRAAAKETVERVNKLIALAAADGVVLEKNRHGTGVNSGWRPLAVNQGTSNAAPRSKHIHCLACDLHDPDGDLDDWCMKNQDKLEAIGLWIEHPSATKGWCHVQIVPPRSGARVFYP
jgi:hypothetical protein